MNELIGRKPLLKNNYKLIGSALLISAALLLSACGTTTGSAAFSPQSLLAEQSGASSVAPVFGLQTSSYSYGGGVGIEPKAGGKVESAAALGTPVIRDGKVWIYQPTAIPGPTVARVTLAPVTTDRNFDARPYDPAYVAVGTSIPDAAPDNLSQWILVSGNYTPKGIYTRPDTTSRILTRVAPGSRLRLESTHEGWLKVETTSGIGYLKAHDAKRISASQDTAKKRVINGTTANL